MRMRAILFNILFWITFAGLPSCTGQIHGNQDANTLDTTGSPAADPENPAHDSSTMDKTELEKLYSRAIADYIKSVYKKDSTVFDTLFFGKRNNGQPDDFPDIELPGAIENTQIRLISPEAGKKLLEERKARVYINMIGWVDKKKAEFILVTFTNGFEHTFDFYCDYVYSDMQKGFVPDRSRIEVLIKDAKGKADHFAIYEEGKFAGNKPVH